MTDTKAEAPAEAGQDDDVDVDIDLLADDALLREALAQPTSIRLPTGDVISVPHMADWPHMGTKYMANALFDAWAESVLSAEDAKAFAAADLHNYQIERITEAVSAAAVVTPGKRKPSSGSQGSKRRR